MATAAGGGGGSSSKKRLQWPSLLRWNRTSTDQLITAEKSLLSLAKTPYAQELVWIGNTSKRTKTGWCTHTSRAEPNLINTVTFETSKKKGSPAPTLVMLHGYGGSLAQFSRNFDTLAQHFTVIAIDQLGFGRSTRPNFTCKTTEESDAWFIDSFEAWRKAKKLTKFILLGHSLGGYVAAKYAVKYPEYVEHLILVGVVGMTSYHERKHELKSSHKPFRQKCEGSVEKYVCEYNITPQKFVRWLGPFGTHAVNWRIGSVMRGGVGLTEEEAQNFTKLLEDLVYHISAAKASGELCLKYTLSHGGAFALSPLLNRITEWKVKTTFIYGHYDTLGTCKEAVDARKKMDGSFPCQIIKISEGGHEVYMQNAPAFNSAVVYAYRRFHPDGQKIDELPPGIELIDD
ncbi:unnamed protein product [Cuscuta europaea]|uniref:AB hydrolase-1 domain-containing protein n=1 Tax=Cuscuta europaea TaxID=41803 RepID=A0A9P1E473_CUSEU|nr:unnamed protein product [Cuscuta europaea]